MVQALRLRYLNIQLENAVKSRASASPLTACGPGNKVATPFPVSRPAITHTSFTQASFPSNTQA